MQADAEVSSKKNKDDLNTDDLSGIVFELKMDLAGFTFFGCAIYISKNSYVPKWKS